MTTHDVDARCSWARVTARQAVGRRIDDQHLFTAHMRWNGEECGIQWEVAYWGAGSGCEGHGTFNAYLLLGEEMMPPGAFDRVWWLEGRDISDEGKRPMIAYDYHGLPVEMDSGLTFYAKRGGHDGERRWVKVGCDYAHSWHSAAGYWEDVEVVISQAKDAARKLREDNPSWLMRCSYDGEFYPREQMLPTKEGRWMHESHADTMPAWLETKEEDA